MPESSRVISENKSLSNVRVMSITNGMPYSGGGYLVSIRVYSDTHRWWTVTAGGNTQEEQDLAEEMLATVRPGMFLNLTGKAEMLLFADRDQEFCNVIKVNKFSIVEPGGKVEAEDHFCNCEHCDKVSKPLY